MTVIVRVPVPSAELERVELKEDDTDGVAAWVPVAVTVVVAERDDVREEVTVRVPVLEPVLEPVPVRVDAGDPVPVPLEVVEPVALVVAVPVVVEVKEGV